MENNNEQSTRSIHQMVEMIIEKGSISREEQQEINMTAFRGAKQPQDAQALSNLTSLICEGKVNVIN
jgi:hypothetical protein